jgi:uncharacterized membrane protein
VIAAGPLFLLASSFLASTVEMVEALTIVLAVGVTREWRSTLVGVAVALVALAAVVAVLGPALTLIPIDALRVVVGTLLLIFGLQWMRKAILRASGYKALHDEAAIYQREVREAQSAAHVVRGGMDWYAFTIAFKGVFLEGLEVVFIVLTFGANAAADGTGSIRLAALGAAIAVVLVTAVGIAARAPLSRVPENSMKFVVGAMLTTFGTFWSAEGVGVAWPGSDLAIVGLLIFYLAVAFGLVWWLKREADARRVPLAVAGGSGD